jgi:hypothetical protein
MPLHDFIPEPRLVEVDAILLGISAEAAMRAARTLDLGRSPLVRALFGLRTLPDRLRGRAEPLRLRLEDLGGGDAGFRVLSDGPLHLAVGAVGRFWEPAIPFAPVDAETFAAIAEPGWGKLAWELRAEPEGPHRSKLVFELRLDATDDDAWKKLRRYYRFIGPASHFIRRHYLRLLARDLGTPEQSEETRPLPGDAFVQHAKGEVTHAITIDAPPEAVWPWLVQMGCHHAGWYAYDALDNGGQRSATELVPEWQRIRVGDVLPATPDGPEGFTVLALDRPHALVLGGLFDAKEGKSLPMHAPKPPAYWQASWAFVLEPVGPSTRLLVRARADIAPDDVLGDVKLRWTALVHGFMETEQLRNLKRRVEHGEPRVDGGPKQAAEAAVGAAGIALDLLTPFLRGVRSHWGLSKEDAERAYPGDRCVPEPTWSWTHAVEVDAPPVDVWPWLAQIGQEKGGFYSYQFLENLVGCSVENATRAHREWEAKVGDTLRLHPDMPPIPIVEVERGRWVVAHGEAPGAEGAKAAAVSWLFFVEPLPGARSRVVSRFRTRVAPGFFARLTQGPYLTESVGFVMDRKMLLGIKERVERARRLDPDLA